MYYKKFNTILLPRGSERTTGKGFVNIVYGDMGGTHWICFHMKDNNPFYLTSFVRQSDNFSLETFQKQSLLMFLKFKIILGSYVKCIVYTFSI